jgi:lysophospholipase L1-like esterase
MIPLFYRLFCFCFLVSYAYGVSAQSHSYLALGDSYTIGESVKKKQRWPRQLVAAINVDSSLLKKPIIIAKTGWRTDELLAATRQFDHQEKYDIISILIGVNNQYQGKNINSFEKDLRALIEEALNLSKNGPISIFALSIPDYSVTPFAQSKEPENIRKEIDEYNALYEIVCNEYGIQFFNITPISRKAAQHTWLLAKDQLHPSAEMYALWVEKIKKEVQSKLSPW